MRKETHIQFWLGNMRGKDQLEDTCIDGCKIPLDLNETGWEGMHWPRLAQVWRRDDLSCKK